MVEPIIGGIIGVILLLVLLFSGIPVSIALGLSGMIGLFVIEGPSGAFLGIAGISFKLLWSISFVAVPMFILMGNLVVEHGLGVDLYDAIYKWFGRLPGGLAIASTIFCAAFGFMCGSSLAGAATVGRMAIPEMESKGYDRHLALGTLCLAGTLAVLIPPSVLMIIYAVEAEISMGALFVAGIFPGLLLAGLMSLFIIVRCTLNPRLGPPGQKFTLAEKIKSLRHLLPLIILFICIIGGIYMGIWAPMEAGGTACLVVVIIALAYRRVSWSKAKAAALATLSTCAMIYILMIGANILTMLFFVSGLTEVVKEAAVGLPLPDWGIVLILLLILMVLGMFMDVLAMILITLPIFVPIIATLGYDPVWWGIMMIVSSEMAFITPPVGLNLFVIQGIAPEGTTLADVALGSLPFVGLLWVFLGLQIVFPGIALWLPNVMK